MKVACGRCWDRDCKCTTQELKEWSTVEEKIYTHSELVSYAKAKLCGFIIDLGIPTDKANKWIKENL